MTHPVIQLDSIGTYNSMYGLKTLHPLVTVVNMEKATKMVNHVTLNYGLYALFLKHGVSCRLMYGREEYDYQEGTIVSFAPGQTVTVDMLPSADPPKVHGLLFHPDLIYGTPLAERMQAYTFLEYSQKESLHMSDREQNIITEILDSIQMELEHPIDKHSGRLITDRIGLMLDYCMRFYDRQFITRHKVNSGIMENFERELNNYFANGRAEREGVPKVAFFADKACLSANYFGDLVKKESGLSAQRYIQNKVIALAKEMIKSEKYTVNEVAFKLGFQYPQHFSRLFKQSTGHTPRDFKAS